MTARIKLKRASLQQKYWRTKDRNCKHFRNASSTWSFARRHRHRYTSQESYTYIKMLNGGVYRLQKWLVCRCQHIFQYQNYTVQNVQELSLFLSLPSISLFEDCHLRVRSVTTNCQRKGYAAIWLGNPHKFYQSYPLRTRVTSGGRPSFSCLLKLSHTPIRKGFTIHFLWNSVMSADPMKCPLNLVLSKNGAAYKRKFVIWWRCRCRCTREV